jgi:hypothetical protein
MRSDVLLDTILACSDFTRASFAALSSRAYSALDDVPIRRRSSVTASEKPVVANSYSLARRVFSRITLKVLPMPSPAATRYWPRRSCAAFGVESAIGCVRSWVGMTAETGCAGGAWRDLAHRESRKSRDRDEVSRHGPRSNASALTPRMRWKRLKRRNGCRLSQAALNIIHDSARGFGDNGRDAL